MSIMVPEQGISSLLEFGSSICVPGGYGLLIDGVSPLKKSSIGGKQYLDYL